MSSLEQHLSLEINQSALLGTFEGTNQRFVIILHGIVVKEIPKQNKWLPWFPDSFDITQQLLTFFVQSSLMTWKAREKE